MQPIRESIQTSEGQSFAYRRFTPMYFPFQWHHHPEAELTLIVRGRGRRYVGDHIEDFTEGDLVLLGPGLPHTWHSRPQGRSRAQAVATQFRPDCFGEPFLASPELRPVRRLLDRASVGLAFHGRAASNAQHTLEAMAKLTPLQRMTRLVDTLGRLAESRQVRRLSTRPFTNPLRDEDRRRIDRVCRFMDEHFNQPLTLADAAPLAHLHPASFARFFKRITGQTFIEYLHRLRVGEACRLLVETDRPITDICFASGFGNVSNFNRIFRRVKGDTPREYRRNFAEPA